MYFQNEILYYKEHGKKLKKIIINKKRQSDIKSKKEFTINAGLFNIKLYR